MATPTDVIHELTGLHRKIAKDLDDAPTGVVPGYHAALGATVTPDGRLRYVGGGPLALLVRAALNTGAVTLTHSSSNIRLDFDTVGYDPQSIVTTGVGSWKAVIPATGWYMVQVTTKLDGGIGWVNGDSMELQLASVTPTVANIIDLDWVYPDTQWGDAIAQGTQTVHLVAGQGLYARISASIANSHDLYAGDSTIAIYT